MQRLITSGLTLLLAGVAFPAATYRTTLGTDDPILTTAGTPHPYLGSNLAPGAELADASLANADLRWADLSGANLLNANLRRVNLSYATLEGVTARSINLSGANLTDLALMFAMLSEADLSFAAFVFSNARGADLEGANFFFADLEGSDFSGANLEQAESLGSTTGASFYNLRTNFAGTGFDPVAAGWILIPEPGTGVLVFLGLGALVFRRDRYAGCGMEQDPRRDASFRLRRRNV